MMGNSRPIPIGVFSGMLMLFFVWLLFFPNSLADFISISGLLGLFIIFFSFTHYGNIQLGEGKGPFLPWLGKIFLIEGLFVLGFWSIANSLFQGGVLLLDDTQITAKQAALSIIDWMLVYWGPFPFALIALMAVGCAYFYFVKADLSLQPLLKDERISWVLRAYLVLGAGTNAMLLFTTVVALSLFGVVYHSGFELTQISLIVNMCLMLVFLGFCSYALRSKIAFWTRQKSGFLKVTLVYFALMILFLIGGYYIADIFHVDKATFHIFDSLLPDQTPEMRWGFFFWAYCVAATPLMGSYIGRYSKGRSIRSVVLAVFALPFLAWCVYEMICLEWFVLPDMTIPGWIISVMALAAFIVFFHSEKDRQIILIDRTKLGRVYQGDFGDFMSHFYFSTTIMLMLFLAGGLGLLQIIMMPFAILGLGVVLLLTVSFVFSLRQA